MTTCRCPIERGFDGGNLPGADLRHPEPKPERVARPLTILPADHEGQSAWLRRAKLTNL